MIKTNFIPCYWRRVNLHTMVFGLFEALLVGTRWAVSISKMETSLIPNAENSRRQRLAVCRHFQAPRGPAYQQFWGCTCSCGPRTIRWPRRLCSYFSETLFTLDFNSCRSFTSVSYWLLINCTDFFLSGDKSASFVLAMIATSSPSTCLFSLPSCFSVSFCIFYI